MLDKIARIALLLDVYGPLLTERQRQFVELHFDHDLSLGEIAAEFGVSRQAVHDGLSRGEAQLEALEARLGLVERQLARRLGLSELRALVESMAAGIAPADWADRARALLDALDEG